MGGAGRASEHFAVLLLLMPALSPAIAGEGRTPRGERENRWRHRAVDTESMRAPPSIVNGRALPIDGKGTTGKERRRDGGARVDARIPGPVEHRGRHYASPHPGCGKRAPGQNKSVAGTSPATPQT
jgi:hypothetical protein